jgi:hypothetical protein
MENCKLRNGRSWAYVNDEESFAAVLALRYQVLCRTVGLPAPADGEPENMGSADDRLPHVSHLVARCGDLVTGALTVRLPDPSRTDGRRGFELERACLLENADGHRLAEVSRMCVDAVTGPGSLLTLKQGMSHFARRHALHGWVALADSQSNCPEAAARTHEACTRLRGGAMLSRAERIALQRTLPSTLSIFLSLFGAQVIGDPIAHPAFRTRFVIPVYSAVLATSDYPAAITLEQVL